MKDTPFVEASEAPRNVFDIRHGKGVLPRHQNRLSMAFELFRHERLPVPSVRNLSVQATVGDAASALSDAALGVQGDWLDSSRKSLAS
jgi:hypothetical protein